MYCENKDTYELRIRLLTEQLEMKNEIINMLKDRLNLYENQSIERKVEPEPKFKIDHYLNVTCMKAINLTDFFDAYLLDDNLNKFIMYVGHGLNNKNELLLFKNSQKDYFPCGYNFFSDFFCNTLNNIDHHLKPIFCSDEHREVFYVKEKNSWSKINLDELFKIIYSKLSYHIPMCYMNMSNLSPANFKHVYKIEKANWAWNHQNAICSAAMPTKTDVKNQLMKDLAAICCKKKINYVSKQPDKWTDFDGEIDNEIVSDEE